MRKGRVAVDAYTTIRDMILSGQLKPGNKLSDQELAMELGMSRTPVRHALTRLAQEGLIDEGRSRGFHVADLDAKQVADLYALREVLEAHAIRLAVERATVEDLKELAAVLETLDKLSQDSSKRGEEIRVGLKIHEIIARASGDTFLHETMVRLLNRMHFFIWMDTLNEDPQAAEATRREHRELLACIRAGKSDEAEAVIRAHIRTAKQGILKVFEARDTFYQPAQATVVEERASGGLASTLH